jgi:hypothetical protein
MADLRCCDFSDIHVMQNSLPLDLIIRPIGQDGIAKSNDNFLKLTMAQQRTGLKQPARCALPEGQKKPSFFGL